ncbi:MAG: D-alanyl-D-alanine carboxypeptidase [Ruminococcaceae bacterium]|nr:D-alanyl-D-alanine carboxypeptidase [Oscillospiraceae bacterium]
MKLRAKHFLSFFLALLCVVWMIPTAGAERVETVDTVELALPCASAILMDAATGQVLYEQNADQALPPASVTKIMTLLLVMEAVDDGRIALTDLVTVSARAASMGGSQVFLKEGEQMSVEEMLKCVVIASANDCAVALAEFVSGSEEGFVRAMNERAAALGMKNTHFENTNGLDDTARNHVTSARDIAIMSRALISHEKILEYSGIWMDTVRDGTFGLTNTNRLVRFYPGCTGLKTGSTAKAKFCISATAERDGLSLICVIMAAETRDIRNAAASKLLDYGFATYAAYRAKGEETALAVRGGVSPLVRVGCEEFCAVVPKGKSGAVERTVELPEALQAPVAAGDTVGHVVYRLDGAEIGSTPLLACETVERIGFSTLFCRLLSQFLLI